LAENASQALISKKLPTFDQCCIVCEEKADAAGAVVKCGGTCKQSFHVGCVQKEKDKVETDGSWKCEACSSGKNLWMATDFHF